ncbi:methyltransferase domain-containing protein [Kribbella sp. NPDC051587]|uniref:methyltransferase domain-containing protein n=1 Tax=Kribbella sp. NPDC051587 TaxID=3364119 RepID=UPI0037ADE711
MNQPTIDDWPSLADAMASEVRRAACLRNDALFQAFAAIPRHLFVPTYYRTETNADGWDSVTGIVDESHPDWLTTVYSNTALVTQLKPIEGQPSSETYTSSSSMPTVMADMIEELGIRPGMKVLEIGTGTGYNAAILCHLLGDDAVTTLDIDEELVDLARERLASLDYHPSFEPQDGTYDRILATHSVDDIPAEWLRWGKPGAVILTDLRSPANSSMGAWAKVAIGRDGSGAVGALMPARGYFMGARRTPEFAHAGDTTPEFTDDEHRTRANAMETRPTKVPASVLETGDFGLYLWRQAPEIRWFASSGTASLNGPRAESWAYVTEDSVHYGGLEDLWSPVERAYSAWEGAGRPGISTWLIRVDKSGKATIDLPPRRGR